MTPKEAFLKRLQDMEAEAEKKLDNAITVGWSDVEIHSIESELETIHKVLEEYKRFIRQDI